VCAQGGKNDIVSAAAGYIRDLEGRKQWLRARNDELLEQAARAGSSMVVKVRAESEQHSVAVDVFETVLRRLKAMEELRVTGIRSCFHDGGMWMDITVRCEVPSLDVDKAITNALMKDAEENALGMQVPRSGKPAFSCQVEWGAPNVLTF
jgi:succinylarginine dihydrolase